MMFQHAPAKTLDKRIGHIFRDVGEHSLDVAIISSFVFIVSDLKYGGGILTFKTCAGRGLSFDCDILVMSTWCPNAQIFGNLCQRPPGLLAASCHPPRWLSGKEPTCQCRRQKRCGFDPWVRKICCSRKWQPTPVFLPREFHGQRSLAGPVHRVAESDVTE